MTFYTTAHGSGRTMSRHQARKLVQGRKLLDDMEKQGIHVRTDSYGGLAEEAGLAYKDIDVVTKATEDAGLSRRVVKLVPIGNIKG
jgi:tRNA-splicing ligase RtcB